MRPTTATIVLLMALTFLVLFILILLCRPWRFFSASSFLCASSRRASAAPTAVDEVDDVSRPLFFESTDSDPGQGYNFAGIIDEESRIPIDGNTIRPRIHGLLGKRKVQATDTNVFQGDSLVLDVTTSNFEDLPPIISTVRPLISNWLDDLKLPKKHSASDAKNTNDNGRRYDFALEDNMLTRSILNLEVVGGPSCGLYCSRQSSKDSNLPLTIGRVPPCDLLLKDSEVSGKHAVINWNINSSKWELIDMGSLNGTFVNSQAVGHLDSGSRCWSKPFELADGDMIKLGTTSKISVNISYSSERQAPAGVGIASDPMASRRGGKKLPMEDVLFCQWPLSGVEQFGLFAIFDGHGGVGAAKAACKILPDNVINILSQPERIASVFSLCDASDVLRDAFTKTESAMNHQYEGCTATVLLIWFDYDKELFAQCANVGDSACFINLNGELISMTEDHRVISPCERARLMKTGKPLKDGETRLCGLNISRMLGDKFLKEQDDRFSSEPYISKVVAVEKACTAFALMASDGLWDVINIKNAAHLALQSKRQFNSDTEASAEMIANCVLSEARSLRTKDNTSVIFLDFDVLRTDIL